MSPTHLQSTIDAAIARLVEIRLRTICAARLVDENDADTLRELAKAADDVAAAIDAPLTLIAYHAGCLPGFSTIASDAVEDLSQTIRGRAADLDARAYRGEPDDEHRLTKQELV